MGERARSKIQRLLQELGDPDAEDLAAESGGDQEPGPARGRDGDGGGGGDSGLLLLSLGLGPGRGGRASTGPARNNDYGSDEASSTMSPASSSVDNDASMALGLRGRGGGRENAALLERLAQADRRVQQLMAQNRAMHAGHAEAMAAKHAEAEELRAHLAGTVRELHARQAELEAAAPLLQLRLEDFRAQLADLRVSDAVARDLKLLPAGQRAPLDELRIAVHDAVADSRTEADRLRSTLATAREAAARAEEVCQAVNAHARGCGVFFLGGGGGEGRGGEGRGAP